MADKIVDVVLTVKIPVSDYEEAIADLLAEIESAAQHEGVTYQNPEVRYGRA